MAQGNGQLLYPGLTRVLQESATHIGSEKRSVRQNGTGRMVSAFDSLAYWALLRIVVFAQLPFLVKNPVLP